MNKRILIKIIRETLEAYQNGELTSEKFESIIANTPHLRLDDQIITYYETQLLCYIFETIPYYRICDNMITFTNYLKKIVTNNNEIKFYADLVESYISDIFCNIDSRIATEVNTHLYELAEIYYQCGELDYELTIKRLKRQLVPAHYIVSLDTASNALYVQEKLPGFSTDSESNRDKVSRNNYNKKSASERNLKKLIAKFYDENSLQEFTHSIDEVLNKYNRENPDDIDVEFLRDHLKMSITSITPAIKKEWEKNKVKEEDENQYRLIFS